MAIVKQSLADWQAEVKERLGEPADPSKLAFKCPRCENVATAQEFIDLGEDADSAAQKCIGRLLNADDDPGCDWCAYGLLGVLSNGRILTKPDGDTVQVFEFAAPDSNTREEAG